MNRSIGLSLLVCGLVCCLFFPVGCSKKRKPEPAVSTPTPIPEIPTATPQPIREPEISEEELARQRYEKEKQEVFKNIYFDFDKATLSIKARAVLSGIGDWMIEHPGKKVLIEGHCDERGSEEYNLALGERRANAAKEYLISYGVSADRLRTISYGEERPADPRHNEEAWAKNRRAHFVVID